MLTNLTTVLPDSKGTIQSMYHLDPKLCSSTNEMCMSKMSECNSLLFLMMECSAKSYAWDVAHGAGTGPLAT